MFREKKQLEPEAESGAPQWMVTFSDCMTLLLTFFVLLISFSSFGGGNGKLRELGTIFKGEFSLGKQEKDNLESFISPTQVMPVDKIDNGSEKPTLDEGVSGNLNESNNDSDFQNRKVFVIASDKIFWGKGNVISADGRKILEDMAVFLKEANARVVISETSPEENSGNDTGLQRAWAVLECFTQAGLSKDIFSVSASGTVSAASVGADRKLEIVLLERSIYN
jgi:chemotaxis protein MotB